MNKKIMNIMGGTAKSWVHGTCSRLCHEFGLTLSVIGMGVHAVCPLPYTMHKVSWEMKSVQPSSTAFKSVESHKADTSVWPLGILFFSSGSDKKLTTYNRGRRWPEKMKLGDIVEERKYKPYRRLRVHPLL